MLTQGSMWIDLTIGGITMFSTEHSYNCLSSFKINQLTWISGSLPHSPIIFKYNRHLLNFSAVSEGSPIASLHLWHFSCRQRGLDWGKVGKVSPLTVICDGCLVPILAMLVCLWVFCSWFDVFFFTVYICRCVLLKMIHKLGTWSRTLRWWGTLADKKQFD